MKIKLREIILVGLGIFILLAIVSFFALKEERLVIALDREEYKIGENIRIKIENHFLEKVCFSSCYPYYLELRNNEWKSYNYRECLDVNTAESCIEPGKVKAFEISLLGTKEGLHRISLPACIHCFEGEEFRKDEVFYSNEFKIK